MPAPPTIVTYNPTDGVADEWENVSLTASSATTVSNEGTHGFEVSCADTNNNNVIVGHWTAEFKL
jgi:hypothetical protein